MKKNKKYANGLIKRKNLRLLLVQNGIKRVNEEALEAIESALENALSNLFNALKEEIVIRGKKTLEKEDVSNVLEKIRKEEFWEI